MGSRLIHCAIFLIFLTTCVVAARRNRRPNVVILFADDLGYGDLQVYGHPTSSTPNLNRLAFGGKVFTQFYAAAAICSPSRAALLTGRYHMRSGIYPGVFNVTSSGGLPHREITIAEMLKTRGYYTAMVGKWHLGVGRGGEYLPPSQGFDEFLGLPASHSHCPCSVCFHPNRTCVYSCKQNFSPCPLYNGTTIIEQPIDLMTLDEKYATQARKAIRRSVDAEKPFFLYYSFQHTHSPQYADWRHTGTTMRGDFGDSLAAMDWEIGQVIKELEYNNVLNDTFIFFTADNGPSLSKRWGGSVGLLKCGKATTYEGGVRVPAIAHWPGRIDPGFTLELSSTLDLLPTIAKITGARLPAVTLDGVDMGPFLFNGGKSLRETFFYYSPAANEKQSSFAVRYRQYKAHFYTKGSTLSGMGHPDPDCRKSAKRTKHSPPLLYDLHRDPAEQYNIAWEPEYTEVIMLMMRIRDDFDSRMVWATSEMHKPSYNELMPCCNPGCEPQPYCCHCTLTSSIAYDFWELYTDMWQDRDRDARMKRKERMRIKAELFQSEREGGRRGGETPTFPKDKRGRDNNRDIFEGGGAGGRESRRDNTQDGGRDRIRDGNKAVNIFEETAIGNNDRERRREKLRNPDGVRDKDVEIPRERTKPRGRIRITLEEDDAPIGSDHERGRDQAVGEDGRIFGESRKERRRDGTQREGRSNGRGGAAIDTAGELLGENNYGSGFHFQYLEPTVIEPTRETPRVEDHVFNYNRDEEDVDGTDGSHRSGSGTGETGDLTALSNIRNYFDGFVGWGSSHEAEVYEGDEDVEDDHHYQQEVNNLGSTFEDVFEMTTDAAAEIDTDNRRIRHRNQKNNGKRTERQNRKEYRRGQLGENRGEGQRLNF